VKATEWKRVVRPLVPAGERWEFSGSLCYRAPVGRFLLGVLGEGSGFDRGVYVWRVSMPLFVPSDAVVLSYSERVGGGSKKYDPANLEGLLRAISSGFRDLPSEDGELRRLVRLATGSPNVRLLEAAAYGQVLLGNQVAALDVINQVVDATTRYDWEQEVVDRVARFGGTLGKRGLEAATRELDAQVKRTGAAIGVIRG
jgi:hypothetical protein